jgi:fucose permease
LQSPAQARSWYWATFACFFIQGLMFASWVSRTPEVQDSLRLDTAGMGLFTLVMAVGSILSLLFGSRLLGAYGAKRAMLISYTSSAIFISLLGWFAVLGWLPAATFAIFFLGVSMGLTGLTINIEGASIDRESPKSLLPSLHGAYSLGCLIGAAVGTVLILGHVSVASQFIAVGAILVATVWTATRYIPSDSGMHVTASMNTAEISTLPSPAERRAVWRETRTLLVCLIVFGFIFAEGTAMTWLPISMVDAGFTQAVGSAMFTTFVAFMTLGRFLGGPIVDRLGRATTIFVVGLIAIAGIVLVATTNIWHLPFLGAALWGFGLSVGVPLCVSCVSDDPRLAPPRVSLIFLTGNVAGLAGPPVIGALGQIFGLFGAFGLPVAFLVVGTFFNRVTRTSSQPAITLAGQVSTNE